MTVKPKLQDIVKDADSINETQSRYGIFPDGKEHVDDYKKRVFDTVNHKKNPSAHPFFSLLVRNKDYTVTTDEVERIALRYLGISNPPLDAFENRCAKRGLTVEDNDGSAIIVTEDLPDNTRSLIDVVSSCMTRIVKGEKIEFDSDNTSFKKVYQAAGFKSDNDLHNMFIQTYDELISNETFIKLHEVIHAIYVNNNDYGRRNLKRKLGISMLSEVLASKLPAVGPIFRSKRFDYHILTEYFAYKVGLDECVKDIFDEAAKIVNTENPGLVGEAELEYLNDSFREMNTAFTKAVIKEAYLKDKSKGYGSATKEYTSALTKGFIGSYLIQKEGLLAQGIGVLFLLSAAGNSLNSIFSLYFGRRIDSTSDMIETLIEKYGSSRDAYYNSLGKSRSQLKKIAYHN